MRHPSRQVRTMVAAIAAALCLSGAVPAYAQGSSDPTQGLCAILTEAQVSAAIGLAMTVAFALDDDCYYESDTASLDVALKPGTLDDVPANMDPQVVTVAGQPGLKTSDGAFLWIGTDQGTLALNLAGPAGPGTDVATALETLGTMALVGLAANPVPSAPPASAFCSILTTAEVGAALLLDFSIGQYSDIACYYDASNGYTSLDLIIGSEPLADYRTSRSDYTDVTVGGQPALLQADGAHLVIQTDQGTLVMILSQYIGELTDTSAAMQALGAAAVARLPSIPLAP